MSDKLGFTFYPKDWWTSDTFFELTSSERYIFLECMFIMYQNDGVMKTQKTQFENRTRINVTEEEWINVTNKFMVIDGLFTLLSVNKRLRKAISSRENGGLGGRPKGTPNKPKKPKEETQNNPPLESEIESKEETEEEAEKFIPIDKDLLKDIMEFFNFTESANYNKMGEIRSFLICLNAQGRGDYFKKQFSDYCKVKNENPKFKHAFPNYLGTPSKLYIDGAWDAENWSSKITEETPKVLGYTPQIPN